jgi:dihydroorotate dehydrogenase
MKKVELWASSVMVYTAHVGEGKGACKEFVRTIREPKK